MKNMKFCLFAFLLFLAFVGFQQSAEAHSSFFLGFSYRHPGYYPYYYPYYSWNFWYPFGYYPYYSPYYYGPYSGAYYHDYGSIRLEVKPKTAKVYLDGDYVGVVDDFDGWNQRLDTESGKHRVVLRESGFAPYVETLRVLPGRDYHIKVALKPGEDVISEREMRLEQREYPRRDRTYDSDRYRERDRDQEREESGPAAIPEQQMGANTKMMILQVQPRDATIYIDGNYYGTADVNESGDVQILLPKGEHKLEIVRPGYEPFTKEIRVDENSNEKITVNLQKK